MTDDYNKKIGVQKEVLEALPRNNAKNNKLYKEKVIELKEQYDNDLMLLSEEIIKRKNEYMNALPDKKIDEITISMKDIYNKLVIVLILLMKRVGLINFYIDLVIFILILMKILIKIF